MATMDAGLDLLDREVLDVDGNPVGKVDDVDLTDPDDGAPPAIAALLLGPAAYGRRLGGRVGDWICRAGTRLAGTDEPIRIPMEMVADLGVSVTLSVSLDDLQRPARVERWLREHFIGRIPGAHRASE